jgi:hypothetical protein
MKTHTVQQEVLLVTNTRFARHQYKKMLASCTPDPQDHATAHEKLRDACWNGLLPSMLPEIYELPRIETNLFMWQIREAKGYLALELGEYPEPMDYFCSIDPNSFLEYWSEN